METLYNNFKKHDLVLHYTGGLYLFVAYEKNKDFCKITPVLDIKDEDYHIICDAKHLKVKGRFIKFKD